MSLTGPEIRARVCETALQAVETVRARRLRDLERVRAAHAALAITSLDGAGLSTALKEMRAHLATVAELSRPYEGRDYVTWNQQNVTASESHYAQWLTRMVIRYSSLYEGELCAEQARAGAPALFHARLFEVAGGDAGFDDTFVEGPAGVTAYEAKTLLAYALPPEARRELFKHLELRFDLRDVVPAEQLGLVGELAGASPYACSVLTDGYFYGALRANAQALLNGVPGSLGMGIDCSTLVQEAYESAGFGADLFVSPVSTASMIAGGMPGLRSGAFEVRPLTEAEALRPGDAILRAGHVQLYLGRDDRGRLRTAEAVGRRFKTVRECLFPLRDSTAGGISAFANPERPLYVFRPTGI